MQIPQNPTSKMLRQFAAAWMVIWLLLAMRHPRYAYLLVGSGVVVGMAGLLKPEMVRHLFLALMIVVFPIGWIVSHIVLAIMFYLVITPVAVFFWLRGRDVLHRQPHPNQPSYWVEKKAQRDLRRYFCQY